MLDARRTARLSVSIAAVLVGTFVACGQEPASPPSEVDTLRTVPDDSVAATPTPDPFPAFARRATAIELGLDAYREVDGMWVAGDASSTYSAYFEADSLRLIEESISMGDYGDATAVYYFDVGTPFYIVQDEVRTRLDPGAAGLSDTLQTRVAFGPEGGLVATERIVNGTLGEAPPVEVEGLWNHAVALAEQARSEVRPAL